MSFYTYTSSLFFAMNAYQSTAWFVINMILNVLYVGKEEKLSTYEYAF